MPKAERGTPKDIANRMKAKGLQKLRWYCQMCEKQCRDANGFKCHQRSEGHLRMMSIAAQNPSKYLDQFSKTFEQGFLKLLSRRFGERRVHANIVYNEFIKDKHHVHMNATQWESLTSFVKYLAQTNQCKIDETEKGWFIEYIDRSPEAMKRKEDMEKRRKAETVVKAHQEKYIEELIEQNKEKQQALEAEEEEKKKEIDLEEDRGKVSLSLSKPKDKTPALAKPKLTKPALFSADDDGAAASKASGGGGGGSQGSKKRSNLEEVIQEEMRKRQRSDDSKRSSSDADGRLTNAGRRKEAWLFTGIVVKVINKKLADGKFYKQKGVVQKLEDEFVGRIKLLDSGTKLKIDQAHLETVIPKVGGDVLFVNGRFRGEEGRIKSINFDKYCVDVTLTTGEFKNSTVEGVEYEDVCRLA